MNNNETKLFILLGRKPKLDDSSHLKALLNLVSLKSACLIFTSGLSDGKKNEGVKEKKEEG